MKPYKDENPINTIKKAKKILSDLGFLITENHYFIGKYLNACSVKAVNKSLKGYKIKTYGKGSNSEFALASAYGEFFERLQNGFLIKNVAFSTSLKVKKNKSNNFKDRLKEKNAILKFSYDPREIIISTEEFIKQNNSLSKKLFLINDDKLLEKYIKNKLGYSELICVPFYDQKDHKEIFVPIEILFEICGSNGMCAGNTSEEAIIQGLCEIFERYAINQVYFNHLTPPTIPKKSFKVDSNALKIISEMEKKGMEITIKDFSLGKNLPVIGIIIIDKLNHKYNVKVGADLVPQRALERCLHEFYQSTITPNLLPIEKMQLTKEKDKFVDLVNFNNICSNSTGNWFKSILSNKFSYEFKGLNNTLGQTHSADLKHVKLLVSDLKSSIYIRDTSFLGFKSFYIFIPNISNYKRNNTENYLLYSKFWKNQINLLSIKKLNNKELSNLIKSIEKGQKINPRFWIDIVKPSFGYHSNEDLNNLDLNLFLSLGHYQLGNLDLSVKYISTFLDEFGNKNRTSFLYFYAYNDYFKLKKESLSAKEIKKSLKFIYPEELIIEVIKDLENPKNIFQLFKLPTCYDCKNCEIVESCNYFDIMGIVNNIQKIQVKKKINQISLKEYF